MPTEGHLILPVEDVSSAVVATLNRSDRFEYLSPPPPATGAVAAGAGVDIKPLIDCCCDDCKPDGCKGAEKYKTA